MRLDGAKKSQGACQDLIPWEDSGAAMLDLGLLLRSFVFRACRELAHPPNVAGPLAGRLPSEKGPRRGNTKRLGVIQGHLAWSEVLHKGQPDCKKDGTQAGQSMAEHGRGMTATR